MPHDVENLIRNHLSESVSSQVKQVEDGVLIQHEAIKWGGDGFEETLDLLRRMLSGIDHEICRINGTMNWLARQRAA